MAVLDEILERLTQMPDEDKAKIAEEVDSSLNNALWVPNPGPQTEAALSLADLLYVGGAGGGGKQVRYKAYSLIWRQWRSRISGLMRSETMILQSKYIQVGDYFPGSNGKPTKIIHKTEPENRPFYRVTFNDGSYLDVSDNHNWTVFDASKRAKGDKERGNFKDQKTTIEIISSGLKYRDQRRFSIPLLSGPIDMPGSVKPKLPPYALGYWLGNGSSQGTVFTCHLDDAADIIHLLSESLGRDLRWKQYDKDALRSTILAPGWLVQLANAGWPYELKAYTFRKNVKVFNKDQGISEINWRLWSVSDRKKLLAGLIDSDGHASLRGDYEFDNTSRPMVCLVRGILQSLGQRPTAVKSKKTRVNEKPLFRIKGVASEQIFMLPRKADRLRCRTTKALSRRYIESIEPIGDDIGVCFSVEAEDHLFVAGDDYVVTHNSDLGLGLAFTEHEKTLIMRRQYTDLSGLTDRAIEINGTRDGFNGSPPPKLKTINGRVIQFGAAAKVGDERTWQGRPHDLIYIDEAVHFAESQIRFLMGWLRSTTVGQRCRVVLGSNPPLSDEGVWIVNMFAAWLDPQHPNPAKSGELRWYVTDAEIDYEVEGDGEWMIEGGYARKAVLSEIDDADINTLTSLSRTFIPSKLKDNPFLMKDKQYKAQQDALPPDLRDAIRDGDFNAAREDHDLQLIPSSWIQAAQRRWRPQPHNKAPQCAIGVDIAQGGKDKTVFAPRYDGWYDKLIKMPGKKTPDGKTVAGLIIKYRTDKSFIILDMGGGYGGATYEKLIENIPEEVVIKHKGSEKSKEKTKEGGLNFFNKRAEVYYRFYEALDPSQPGGSKIALPPDPMLFVQLCAIRKKERDLIVIRLEPKKDLIERLGFSTDEADAVVQSWSRGPKQDNFRGGWDGYHSNQHQRKVIKAPRSASRFDNRKRKW